MFFPIFFTEFTISFHGLLTDLCGKKVVRHRLFKALYILYVLTFLEGSENTFTEVLDEQTFRKRMLSSDEDMFVMKYSRECKESELIIKANLPDTAFAIMDVLSSLFPRSCKCK